MAKIGLSLSDYFLIVRKRRWVAILCFLVVFLSTVIHTSMQLPVYRAVSQVRMIERRSVSDMITQMVSYTSFDVMSSLTMVIVGRPVVERVVYRLGLANENTSKEDLENIILSIQNKTTAENVSGTNIVNIIVEDTDPRMAAKIVNAIAEVFVEVDTDEKNEKVKNARIFIEEQLGKVKQRLTDSEEKLKSFKESGKATGIAVTLQNNLANLETQKIELKRIYTEKYPDVVKINEQIEKIKEQLQSLPEDETEYARLTREFNTNERSYLLLQGKLEEARIAEAEKIQDIKIVDYATTPQSPVKPNKKLAIMSGLIIGLVVGLFLTFVVETFDTSIGTIEDLEALLRLPVLAVIPYMKPKSKEQKRSWRDWLPWELAKSKNKKSSAESLVENTKQQLLIRHSPKSTTMEAYRILRTNVNIEDLLKNDQRILIITSTLPQEGKSITALNLALALAQDGYKTLLIDADLRKAVIHKVFNIDKEPGLSDILLGTSTPQGAIRSFIDIMMNDPDIKDILKVPGLDNFYLLTCGKIVTNPAELLDSPKIISLFSDLKSQYNILVVDTPPVLPVTDTIILSTKIANKLYLVYRAGYTSKIAISRAKEQLDMMKAITSGVILNSTTPESQIVSDYYHHYYHYRYYTDKEQ